METSHGTTDQTMRTAKGNDYVNAWPNAMATKYSVHPNLVADAINETLGTTITDNAFLRDDPAALDIVGNLTPADVQAIRPRLADYSRQAAEARRTQCTCCGLPTRNGHCEGCH